MTNEDAAGWLYGALVGYEALCKIAPALAVVCLNYDLPQRSAKERVNQAQQQLGIAAAKAVVFSVAATQCNSGSCSVPSHLDKGARALAAYELYTAVDPILDKAASVLSQSRVGSAVKSVFRHLRIA